MRAFNFSPGPAALPDSVLEQARDELLDYRGKGLSVMEMSHRSKEFMEIAEGAEADLRELLGIGDDYHVLFLQGGASMQFAAVPFNLCGPDDTVDYIHTGSWGSKAIAEAERLASVNVAATSEATNFDRIPPRSSWRLSPDAAYCHIVTNETIHGVQFHDFPATPAPLVADMSSELLSRPIDVSRFGLVYAGAQKNLGPAGFAVVIVHRDLARRARPGTPRPLDYGIQAEHGSMFNTPPTFAIYLAALVLRWLKAAGGVAKMAEINRRKATKLYALLDTSNFYRSPVARHDRSVMNVPFTLADAALDGAFLAGAEARRLLNLKGHRSVGGMRASLYNAVSEEAVDALVDYMASFEAEHG
ncbi:MAG: 3-phosphoserine/phosphohydroxythreonine transaminase [Gammaproteobacteria bacterium]|nr:3-phosphoserine/phosphohydroxythreonine transaminase [Gammaproteobacteria bacterium]